MKPPAKPRPLRPRKQGAKPPTGVNRRLTEQTRKMLGKHYANKHGIK